MNQKRLVLLTVIGVGLCTLDAWSYWSFDRSRSQAQRSESDAIRCQALSQEIMALQKRPAVADTHEQATEELAARVESAAKSSGIIGDNLASIAPDPAVRIADSDYLEKATTVDLRQVTLNQLAGLFGEISAVGTDLHIKSLRLTSPQDSSAQRSPNELWSAEFSIAYLIYSPLPKSASVTNNE